MRTGILRYGRMRSVFFFGPAISGAESKLPVIWFNNVKPTQRNRWLLHILYSMGYFDNELNLLSCFTLQESYQKAKLLSQDRLLWKNDVECILKKYILEQLVFLPGGTKQFDHLIVQAFVILMQDLLHENSESSELPPALISSLRIETERSIEQFALNKKSNLLNVTINQLKQKGVQDIPESKCFLNATKICPHEWKQNLNQYGNQKQTEKSKLEQHNLLMEVEHRIDKYSAMSMHSQNAIFIGGPGVGKTTVLQLTALHAMKKGLNVSLSAMMA